MNRFGIIRDMHIQQTIMCFIILSAFIGVSCGNTPESKPVLTLTKQQKDSILKVKEDAKLAAIQAQIPKITYQKMVIQNSKHLDSIRKAYKKGDSLNRIPYRAFTTVNRKDLHYFRVGDTVIIPSLLSSNLTDYSVFPAVYPAADTIPKIIIVSNHWQSYACYEYGKLVRFAACNTGEERKATFPGRYALNWRHILRHSSLNYNWVLPYTWNFHLQAGSAFHQFDMPGRPVSHSCIRQFMDDAKWLFYWGQGAKIMPGTRRYIPLSGTPVIIMDMFDFRRKKGGPWWDIQDNSIKIIMPDNPLNFEEALIPISQIPVASRGSLSNKERYITAEDTLRARGTIRADIKLRPSIQYNKRKKPNVNGTAPTIPQATSSIQAPK